MLAAAMQVHLRLLLKMWQLYTAIFQWTVSGFGSGPWKIKSMMSNVHFSDIHLDPRSLLLYLHSVQRVAHGHSTCPCVFPETTEHQGHNRSTAVLKLTSLNNIAQLRGRSNAELLFVFFSSYSFYYYDIFRKTGPVVKILMVFELPLLRFQDFTRVLLNVFPILWNLVLL